jgi:2-polyprenyl-3-methyl-5-hydroxy-6-metoxy-1,4-benzoquinol methylase
VSSWTAHIASHVEDHQLEAEHVVCPICSSNKFTKIGIVQRDPIVRLNECANCFGAWTSRFPKQEFLDRYYRDFYSKRSESITFDDGDRFAAHLYDLFGFSTKMNRVRILDFGGGDGSIAVGLAKAGLGKSWESAEVIVVDPGASRCESTNANVSIDSISSLDKVEGEFQIVIASAIVEHLPNPRFVLEQLFSLLALSGQIYFRTPYITPFVRLLGDRFNALYPAHLLDLGRKFWNKVPVLLGVESRVVRRFSKPSIVETRFTNYPLRSMASYALKFPFYVGIRSFPFVGGWEAVFEKRA